MAGPCVPSRAVSLARVETLQPEPARNECFAGTVHVIPPFSQAHAQRKFKFKSS